jgi:putative ABC transport system permease protein
MSSLQNVAAGLRTLFGKKQAELEMDEELREYLDEAMKEKLRSGMSREKALRAARVEMGSMEAVKDGIRSAGWESTVEGVWQDLRYAVRVLNKNRGFTVVAILTLALGIGANTAIFSLINSVMLRLLPVSHPEELMQVRIQDPRWNGEASPSFTNALWEQIRDRQDVFSGAAAWGDARFDLARGGAVHYVNSIWVSGDYFNTLKVRPVAGRLITAADDRRGCPAVAVLSYGFWQDYYAGADSAIGSRLSLTAHSFEVIGVAPPGFYGTTVGAKFDVAVPVCAAVIFDGKESRLDHRSWWWLTVMGRIRPGVSQAQLEARLGLLSPRILGEALPHDWSADQQKNFLKKSFVAVPAGNGISRLRRQFDGPLQILMAVVALVLLIACANIASLMMARGAARHKEIAVRQALGAGRTRLIRQLLTECVLLSSGGALAGIVFARWGTAQLVRFISTAQGPVFLDLSLDGRVLGFTAAVTVLTSILFGVLPALRSTRVSLMSAMKAAQMLERGNHPRLGAHKWIVASQVALSLVLLVAAGLLLRSFAKLVTLDIGFDRNNVLMVQSDLKAAKVPPAQQLAVDEAVEERLRALPGVISAARSVMTPISGAAWNNNIQTDWSKALTGDDALTWFNYVSPAYFETLHMPILAGRGFAGRDSKTAPLVAIVNQTLARRFSPNMNPVGRIFRIDEISGQPGKPIEVVGVVRDSKYESVREATLPTAFFPATQVPDHADSETFELRTVVRPSTLIPAAQAAIAQVNKEIPLEFQTLAGQVDDSLVEERMLALLSGFFGALALLLAMIGLYGTLSYLVTQRQTEFGIRMALGAESGAILGLVMRDGLRVLAGGVAAGVCISLGATQFLQKMLFGIGTHDTVTIFVAIGVLTTVTLLAGYLPARRATRLDPMAALRHE